MKFVIGLSVVVSILVTACADNGEAPAFPSGAATEIAIDEEPDILQLPAGNMSEESLRISVRDDIIFLGLDAICDGFLGHKSDEEMIQKVVENYEEPGVYLLRWPAADTPRHDLLREAVITREECERAADMQ